VLQDAAMPLDIRIISEMIDFPAEDQAELSQLADRLCALNRGEPDRLRVFVARTIDLAARWPRSRARRRCKPWRRGVRT
jgi:cytochrome P450